METIDNIRKAGLKMTPQRIAVYKTMIELRHAKLEAIVEHLRETYSNMTLSTVYRVLESFCKNGLLTLVCRPDNGECYYDITIKNHHHVFDGNKIIDYNDEELTKLVSDYLHKRNPDLKDISKIQVQITLS
ncbi:MAG: transcriptional repressor [Muribaculaceae bacterium]|nr:transcriptional repressor [Muribaculaceae bacterium]